MTIRYLPAGPICAECGAVCMALRVRHGHGRYACTAVRNCPQHMKVFELPHSETQDVEPTEDETLRLRLDAGYAFEVGAMPNG